MKKGFSLIELSIVLVILGLLTGGILAGKSLIRAAELRSVSTEYSRYVTATQAFRDKYFYLPGDMPNATSVWGDQASGTSSCASAATADGTPGTCNGNGDGLMGDGSNNLGAENMRYWQQLALAGIIEGNYDGYLTGGDVVVGSTIPRSKLADQVGWSMVYRNTLSTNPVYGRSATFFFLGMRRGVADMYGTPLLPEEAWNLDTKTDDGNPITGRIMGGFSSCTSPNLSESSTPTPGTTYAYSLTLATQSCRMWFLFQ